MLQTTVIVSGGFKNKNYYDTNCKNTTRSNYHFANNNSPIHCTTKKKEKICVANEEEFGRESHFEAIACQTEMTKERILFLEKY